MSQEKEYMDNFEDMSDENGFQFQFFCESCNYKYRTPYERWVKGAVADRFASRFSGVVGGVLESRVEKMRRDMTDQKLLDAQEQLKGHFHRCGVCSSWVCEKCWVPQEKTCKNCSITIQADQQAQVVGQSAAAAAKAFRDPDNVIPVAGVICPQCGKPAGVGKFCQECGTPVGPSNCPSCGKTVASGAKFCGECGHKLG